MDHEKEKWNFRRSKAAKTIIVLILLVSLAIGSVPLVGRNRMIGFITSLPYINKGSSTWSIGIYSATSKEPLNFRQEEDIKNPVLEAEDVTDVRADFVADPFMIKKKKKWYMFMEVMVEQGEIGMATSTNGLNWEYKKIVLDEPFHLSYPCVFKHEGTYYMIPETHQKNSIRLYKAKKFPEKWNFEKTLLSGKDFVDSTIFQYNGYWWIFSETDPEGNSTLRLYYSKELKGDWKEHPESPIINENSNIARPGGRVVVLDHQLIRYTQDDKPTYGNRVRAYLITSLTKTSYEEHESKINPTLVKGGNSWRADGMHNIDPHPVENKWIACIDGIRRKKGSLAWQVISEIGSWVFKVC